MACDQDMVRKYRCSNQGGTYAFETLSTGSHGQLGAPAMQMLNRLAATAKDAGKVDKSVFVAFMLWGNGA
jgi:hypothetical protein